MRIEDEWNKLPVWVKKMIARNIQECNGDCSNGHCCNQEKTIGEPEPVTVEFTEIKEGQ